MSKKELIEKVKECRENGVIGDKKYSECMDILEDMEFGDVWKAFKLLFVIMESGWK